MLAGLLLTAIVAGAAATAAALTLSLPLWMALLAYPLAGMTAMLFGGGLFGLPSVVRADTASIADPGRGPRRGREGFINQ